MSLDISIYATVDSNAPDFILLDELSRAFCFLIRCLSENEENCELEQIAAISKIDIGILKKMSSWQVWQKQYGGFQTKEEEQKFILEYNLACDKSWQDIDLVLTCFTQINQALMNDLLFESHINYKFEWLRTQEYFKNFDKNILFNDRLMDKNFGWDLRNIIAFLLSSKKEKIKFVRFQLS